MTRDLVVFGEDWGGHPSSTQHIVRRLARDREVLWVDSIGLRRPRFDLRDLARVGAKLRAMSGKRTPDQPRESMPENMTRLSPKAISWPGSKLARAFNRSALSSQLRCALPKCQATHSVDFLANRCLRCRCLCPFGHRLLLRR
jgi:hypothetical protein